MTEPTCACGRPSPTSQLCTRCYQQLTHDLAHLPELLGELETTKARQARMGGGKRGIGHSEPLPLDVGAMDEGDSTRRCLVTWVRTIIEADGIETWPADDLTAMSIWLLAHVGWARRSDEAEQFAAEIRDVRRSITRRIDRPADLAYAGPCSVPDDTARGMCGTDLYARLGAKVVECPGCGARYDVAERRAWLLEAVADYLATATEIANALTGLDHPVTASMIRQMAHRGEIEGRPGEPHKLYLIGDVLSVLARRKVREAERMSA